MKNKKQKQFENIKGQLYEENISFPKHLTPEIIHSALFVYNARTKEETKVRVEYCAEQIGDEAMSYAMALLVLPQLQQITMQSDDYKEWQAQRIKTLN
mgnify:CR=1 FL=1|tara:strand:+ start:400 stop:693 length:294 start_codon:yes stop_codon:yes gene_type:complete